MSFCAPGFPSGRAAHGGKRTKHHPVKMSMKMSAAILWVTALCVSITAAAKPPVVRKALITLKDGSQRVGRVVRLEQGMYQVAGALVGSQRIPVKDVDHIDYGGKLPEAKPLWGLFGSQGGGLQLPDTVPDRFKGTAREWIIGAILGNQNLREKLQQLHNDPEVQEVLADPEIRKALENNDILTLFKNKKLHALADNATVLEIIRGVLGRQRESLPKPETEGREQSRPSDRQEPSSGR